MSHFHLSSFLCEKSKEKMKEKLVAMGAELSCHKYYVNKYCNILNHTDLFKIITLVGMFSQKQSEFQQGIILKVH